MPSETLNLASSTDRIFPSTSVNLGEFSSWKDYVQQVDRERKRLPWDLSQQDPVIRVHTVDVSLKTNCMHYLNILSHFFLIVEKT